MSSRRWFVLAAVAVGTSYAISPLYTSNQNHHFLTGLARAGDGWLANDWLASTADPFPVFTAYVTFVHRHLSDRLHYLVCYLLFGAYAYGLMRIAEFVTPLRRPSSAAERAAFLAILCVLHNEAIAYLLGIDLRHLQWWQLPYRGVAEQEIFGDGALQASSFGMLLPLAIWWYLDRRPWRAAALVGAVPLLHMGYALTAGAITAACMFVEWRRTHRTASALAVGIIAAAFALPAVIHSAITFGPTTPQVSAAAAAILVRHLPQETMASHWLHAKAWVQIGLVMAGIALAWRTSLAAILIAPFAAGATLTAVQIATGNPQLALLFPWRVSTLLVPIASALLIRRGLAWMLPDGDAARRRIVQFSAAAIAISVVIGAARMVLTFAYFNDARPLTTRLDHVVPMTLRRDFARVLETRAMPMMTSVRAGGAPGQLFITPPDLERFRTVAGQPALADRKSHPYKDVEVLEWRARLDAVEALYSSGLDCDRVSHLISAYGATHLIAEDRVGHLACPGASATYQDGVFTVYRLAAVRPR